VEVEGGIRLRATTDSPEWYARQLAASPLPFEVLGSDALREAVAEQGRRLLDAARPASSRPRETRELQRV
jgi:hypothetical protein